MPTPEQSEQFLDTPPEVAELVATHPEYGHDSRMQAFGPDEAPLVREALVIADRLRHGHIDPGDAFLQGLSYSEAVRKETAARTQFTEDMEAQATVEPERQKPRHLRSILRHASAAIIVFSMTGSSRWSDGDA